MPRVQVIRAFADATKPQSAYEIHDKILAGGGKIDVVSVYRIIATLVEIGTVYYVGIADGYLPSHLEDATTASVVFVDSDSGDAREFRIPSEIIDEVNRQGKVFGFEPSMIKVEILGTCTR